MELRNVGIFAAVTGGRGAMSVKLHGCRECQQKLGATEKRRGVALLDTGKYTLAVRSAPEGGIFDIGACKPYSKTPRRVVTPPVCADSTNRGRTDSFGGFLS